METPVAKSAGEHLDHGEAIEGLLHSEGWLGLEVPPYAAATNANGSAQPEASKQVLLT
jgi:hypothetical protein